MPISRLLTTALLLSAAAAGQSPAAWQSLAPFPAPVREAALIAAAGKIYMFTAQGTGLMPLGLVYEYDPAANRWTPKKRMPLPSHHIATVEHNGKIYFFGGFKAPDTGLSGWEPIDNSWEYDPQTEVWKALAPMPSKRGAGGAAIVDGKVYVIGGMAVHPGMPNASVNYGAEEVPRRSVSTVEEYDLATGKWRERTSMPSPRHHLEVIAVNGKIYALGGRQGLSPNGVGFSDAVEEYDPATDRWNVARARMPVAREDMSWGVYDGRIFIVGGGTRSSITSFETVRQLDAYDPALNQWFALPSLPPNRFPASGAVLGDTLYVLSDDHVTRTTGPGGNEIRPYPFDAIRLGGFFK